MMITAQYFEELKLIAPHRQRLKKRLFPTKGQVDAAREINIVWYRVAEKDRGDSYVGNELTEACKLIKRGVKETVKAVRKG